MSPTCSGYWILDINKINVILILYLFNLLRPYLGPFKTHLSTIAPQNQVPIVLQDKAPYIIYVEVVEVLDSSCSPTPEKILNNLRHVRSEEQLPDDSPGSGATNPPSVVSSGATPGSSNSSHSGATTASHQVIRIAELASEIFLTWF